MRRLPIALGLLVMLGAPVASADGEYGPMFGGSLIGTRPTDDTSSGMAGAEGEIALWYGRIGVALAAGRQVAVDGGESRVTTVDASVRLLVLRHLVPSLLEARDCELGLEAQGIVERAWWENTDRDHAPTAYGFGVALRLRGGSDDASNLLAESRVFIRSLAGRTDRVDAIARDGMVQSRDSGRELSVVVGIGALFGGGQPGYAQRFRPRPFDFQIEPIR